MYRARTRTSPRGFGLTIRFRRSRRLDREAVPPAVLQVARPAAEARRVSQADRASLRQARREQSGFQRAVEVVRVRTVRAAARVEVVVQELDDKTAITVTE